MTPRIWLLLGLSFAIGLSRPLANLADEDKSNVVRRPNCARVQAAPYVNWLPQDTETLCVLREKYTFPLEAKYDESGRFADVLRTDFVQRAFDQTDLKILNEKTVKLWIEAGCRFRAPDLPLFDLIEKDNCEILVFTEPLRELFQTLTTKMVSRRSATRHSIGTFDVVHYTPTHKHNRGVRPQPSFWIVSPQANVLLFASSESYLRAILEKVAVPDETAFPEGLQEWGAIRFDAEIWGMRRFGKLRDTDFSDARIFDPNDGKVATSGIAAASAGFTFQIDETSRQAKLEWFACDEIMEARLRGRIGPSRATFVTTRIPFPLGAIRQEISWSDAKFADDAVARRQLRGDLAEYILWRMGHAWCVSPMPPANRRGK